MKVCSLIRDDSRRQACRLIIAVVVIIHDVHVVKSHHRAFVNNESAYKLCNDVRKS